MKLLEVKVEGGGVREGDEVMISRHTEKEAEKKV